MQISQDYVTLPTIHPVYTLNSLTDKTEELWFVFHGYGQLAAHFIRRFDVLSSERCLVIAPQGLSRFYLSDDYGKVGASWLTKEDRLQDLQNQADYVDCVFDQYRDTIEARKLRLNFFGFSQGVSTMLRFLVRRKIQAERIMSWAGDIPRELEKHDFEFISAPTKIHLIIGKNDQYFDEKVVSLQLNKIQDFTGVVPVQTIFDGKHEVVRSVLKDLL